MLFNSYNFLFYFLPITLIIFYIIKLSKLKFEIYFLSIASLVFYSWNEPKWLFLILASIIINFYLSKVIHKEPRKYKLFLGIIFNLSLIIWFKYRYFLFGDFFQNYDHGKLIIPLAISFFTFQQISFLVDVHDKRSQPFFFIDHVFFNSKFN